MEHPAALHMPPGCCIPHTQLTRANASSAILSVIVKNFINLLAGSRNEGAMSETRGEFIKAKLTELLELSRKDGEKAVMLSYLLSMTLQEARQVYWGERGPA
ncbi:hypothetical protein SAMN05892877_12726 [Rhizobium subbaraonis]|uniref:Uncharacterized protein n=1 Tax=Rhizobium subbaraonis TaxID=908946 RepID=A0A285UZ19_9HYPH|nr:hypothetical protein [Rhizobium subbaraonis]SOC47134.1 hypothetical protein SAMN05892877_12726 [Rhizobium subbaraonis]